MPNIYHIAITSTFSDPDVFEISAAPPLAHHYDAYNRLSNNLPTYGWAFKGWGRIPQAYTLPESKKSYTKGRPIVAFVNTMGRPLWEALAGVLQLMTNQACPHAFRQGDAITQLKQAAQFFQSRRKQQNNTQYVLCNQDPAGFFTSVDKDRFLAAYHCMARWYQDKNWKRAHIFHIDHTQKDPKPRVHRGKEAAESSTKMPPATNTASITTSSTSSHHYFCSMTSQSAARR